MKVALVSHNIVQGDGQGRVNYELTRYLLKLGVEVSLVADRVAPELVGEGARWLPVHPYAESVDLVKVWRFRKKADALLAQWEDRFDAILACGVVCSRPHTVNAVHFVHGTWLASPYHASKVKAGINAQYQRLFSSSNARWEKETFQEARRLVAVSDMVRRELVEIGVPDEKIQVIVNGVDLREFAPAPVDRRALGVPEGVVLGLFVGDIRSPIKNLDGVLHALVDVPSLHLAVAGTSALSPYPGLAESLGVAERVHFLDFRRDVPDLMKAADFFVLPSRRDSCPLVLLEAMASGLPVVTAQTVGTASLASAAGGFVLDTPDDREALTRALRTLAGNPKLRKRLSRAARAVAEQYSWEKMAAQYLELLTSLTSTSTKRRNRRRTGDPVTRVTTP